MTRAQGHKDAGSELTREPIARRAAPLRVAAAIPSATQSHAPRRSGPLPACSHAHPRALGATLTALVRPPSMGRQSPETMKLAH